MMCDVMRCDAMRCDAMRCDAMRCDAMRCDAMRCDAMRCDACVHQDKSTASGVVQVISHIHSGVVDTCGRYFSSLRRRVSFTPRSFLTYIKSFRTLYDRKLAELKVRCRCCIS